MNIKLNDNVHVGHMQKGGAGILGTVVELDGRHIVIENSEGRRFRGLLENTTSIEHAAQESAAEELSIWLGILK
jgi:hypothetical protein